MLAKDKMAALCAHIELEIAKSAHDAMTIQHGFEDGTISLEQAIILMTELKNQFVDCGEEAANEVFKETINRQIQELN